MLEGGKRQSRPGAAGTKTPFAISPSHPNTEWRHAMSSVCTTSAPSVVSQSRAANVVFPAELRPSMATSAGLLDGQTPTTEAATLAKGFIVQGPASGSSGWRRTVRP